MACSGRFRPFDHTAKAEARLSSMRYDAAESTSRSREMARLIIWLSPRRRPGPIATGLAAVILNLANATTSAFMGPGLRRYGIYTSRGRLHPFPRPLWAGVGGGVCAR